MSLYVPITFSQITTLRNQGVPEIDILNVLRRVAIKYTPIIARSAPVDTGRLKRSIRVELLIDRTGLAVTSEVFYAGFQNYGTKRNKAVMFVEKHIPDIISEVISGLESITNQTLSRNPIQQFNNDESGLFSGLTTQTLSETLIKQVVNNLVIPKTVGSLSVSNVQVVDDQIQNLEVTNSVVN